MTGATVVLAGWIRRTSARQRRLESWSGCRENFLLESLGLCGRAHAR